MRNTWWVMPVVWVALLVMAQRFDMPFVAGLCLGMLLNCKVE
jgi:hypothetical protein